MAYIKLREEGKKFITAACKNAGANNNSLLYGKSREGALPFCDPPTPSSYYWTSNAKYNGVTITTNETLGKALIDWFDKYGELYGMDANMIAAQAFQESGFFVWNYPMTSTASGISQFIVEAVYDVIIMNKYGVTPEFTADEIAKITKNLSGNLIDINTYKVSTTIGKQNRPKLHQNICDNPDLMIKAQYRYMKYIANSYTNGIASSALFGYNRGPGYAKPSYADSIKAATNSSNYQMEGINYVYSIFSILGKKGFRIPDVYFGYDELGMNSNPATDFNKYKAEVDISNLNHPS